MPMKVDSMHATCKSEMASKNIEVFTLLEWETVIKAARPAHVSYPQVTRWEFRLCINLV